MGRIKILHIIKSLGRGGAEMLLPETLKIHNTDLFEFHYIYFLPWKNQMVDAIQKGGGKVSCFEVSNNFQLLLQAPKVRQYCIEQEIDLIHCHLPWSGFVGRLVHLKMKIPLLYTEHNIQERYHFLTKFINKRTFNFQSLALGVSEDVTDSIVKNIKPHIPVKTLLNGVNTSKFRRNFAGGIKIREELGIPPEAKVVGNIAVFREQKNIPLWLNAFRNLRDKDDHIYGILVGAGPEEKEIRELISDLDLSDRVVLPGLQSDTVSYFSAMDIFMMSSSFEGLPIALLEAMSMNCAIVSTKAGGVTEAVRDGVDGLLCEVGNLEELSDKAYQLISNDQLRTQFQNHARKRVMESFSLNQMVTTLEEIYDLLEKRQIKELVVT